MKKIIIPLMAVMLLSCLDLPSRAQEFTETIKKEFTLQNDASVTTLFIYNIFGPLKIEGYSGKTVLIEAEETITASDSKIVEIGKREVKLGFEQKSDSIIAYIAEPYDSRPKRNRNNHVDIDYEFKVSYTVKVPYSINLHVATVNGGSIDIKDVSGNLHVNNVNEGITIVNAQGTTRAHTVNGDIHVNYLKNPAEPCSYYTINGDISIIYPQDLSADCQFKSMNGDFFTDFPEVEQLPMAATRKQENKGGKMVYKLDKTSVIRFGKGGKVFRFETLNGNVYIKKQS